MSVSNAVLDCYNSVLDVASGRYYANVRATTGYNVPLLVRRDGGPPELLAHLKDASWDTHTALAAAIDTVVDTDDRREAAVRAARLRRVALDLGAELARLAGRQP